MCMIAMTENDINDNLDLTEDLDLDDDDSQSDDEGAELTTEELLEENKRLKNQNTKLKTKKRKAIDKSSKQATKYGEFDTFYKAKRKEEMFAVDYPGVDFEAVQAIAERKGISMDDALGFIGTAGKAIIGREVTQPAKKTDEYWEKRKKALGIG